MWKRIKRITEGLQLVPGLGSLAVLEDLHEKAVVKIETEQAVDKWEQYLEN
jgi:hypothetical protein